MGGPAVTGRSCAEFECCECRRRIIILTSAVVPEPPLCHDCLHAPGWFRDAELRAKIEPGHNGRERWDDDRP